jgi:hypothetical protein
MVTDVCAHTPASLGPHNFKPAALIGAPEVSSANTFLETGVFQSVDAVSGTAATGATVIVGVNVDDPIRLPGVVLTAPPLP